MITIANRIAPILILLLIGKVLQVKAFISEETVAGIKKLVINLALPAVLFLSFLTIDFQPRYFLFMPAIFAYCVLMYLLGWVLKTRFRLPGEFSPFLITGFEYGLIGVSLFGAAYGLDQLGKLAVIDLGHEIFIWFFFVVLLIRKRDGQMDLRKLLGLFARSPVILALLASLALNISGLSTSLLNWPAAGGFLATLELVGGLTVPLILIVVGYGIRLDRSEIFYSAKIVLIRLAINIPVALILNRFVIRGAMGLDAGFEAALFTLLILPPPFVLNLFMKQDLKAELHRVDNTLTLHTIATLIIFIVYYALNPII